MADVVSNDLLGASNVDRADLASKGEIGRGCKMSVAKGSS